MSKWLSFRDTDGTVLRFRDSTGVLRDIVEKVQQRHNFATLTEAINYIFFKFVDDKKPTYSDEDLIEKIQLTKTLKEMDKTNPIIRSMYAVQNINKSIFNMLLDSNDTDNIMYIVNNTIKRFGNKEDFPHLIKEIEELKKHTIKSLQHDRIGLHTMLKTGAMTRVDMSKLKIIELRSMIKVLDHEEYNPPPKENGQPNKL